jgi:outer membrane receptor protein involved in Fe transport
VDYESGQPVEGARVVLTNERIGLERRKTTDAQGKVRFEGLRPTGSYDVFAPATGDFREARASGLSLRSGFTRSVTLLLPPTTYELEEVVVSGERSVADLNRGNAQVSATLDEAQVQRLPVEGRQLDRALYRLPGVTRATGFFAEAPNVSINGANGLYTNYLIDGLGNNENFLGGPKFNVPIGLAQDVTVLTSTFSAEYGRTGNGVFNVTTKSGDNEHEGQAYYLTRPGPLAGASPYAGRSLSGNAVSTGFTRHQGGFAVGGPIQKDQTFYFANVEQTVDLTSNLLSSPSLGVSRSIDGTNAFTYASGRVDHQWTDDWRTTLRAHQSRVRIDNPGGAPGGGRTFPSAANTETRDATIVALQNSYTSGGFTYEGDLQYSRFHWNAGEAKNPGQPQVRILNDRDRTAAVLGHPGFVFDEREHTLQVKQEMSYLAGEDHALKAGADVITSNFSLQGGGNPAGNYTVSLSDAQRATVSEAAADDDLTVEEIPAGVTVENYAVELRPATFGARQTLWAFYLEDEWSPTSDLTLTAGLRYDYDSLSKGGAGDAFTDGDYDNLAPRLAANYSLTERDVLRGGYGMFYNKIPYAVYSDALERNSAAAGFNNQLRALIDEGALPEDTRIDRITYQGTLTANDPSATFLDGPTAEDLRGQRETAFANARRILNPNGYDNPLTHQFSLGYQRQLREDLLFYVDAVHTRTRHLPRLADLNAPDPYDVTRAQVEGAEDPSELVRTVFEADQTRPFDIYRRDGEGNVLRSDAGDPLFKPGVARQVVVTETKGEARYYAAFVNLVKARQDGERFAYRLGYTLSRRRNNTGDINFRAETGNDFSDEWGPSINDRTHVLSGQLSYFPEAAPGLGVTLAGLLQSGQPINRIPDATVFGTTDLNGDGRNFGAQYVGNADRAPGASRNADRLPWSTTFDVSLCYRLPVAGGRAQVTADVFNVFNTENLSGYTNNATQSNQIQVGPASTGRFVQRNAGPPRQFQFGLTYAF